MYKYDRLLCQNRMVEIRLQLISYEKPEIREVLEQVINKISRIISMTELISKFSRICDN